MKVSKELQDSYSELQDHPKFTNLPIILTCMNWLQKNEQSINFGDDEIEALKAHLIKK